MLVSWILMTLFIWKIKGWFKWVLAPFICLLIYPIGLQITNNWQSLLESSWKLTHEITRAMVWPKHYDEPLLSVLGYAMLGSLVIGFIGGLVNRGHNLSDKE